MSSVPRVGDPVADPVGGDPVGVGEVTPTLSRRHAAGAESARGLLFTVLGELVLPTGGSFWTSTVLDVLGRLGVEPKTVRQALMRTSDGGWLASERVGRRTRWHLTPAAVRLLTEGTERIFTFTGAQPDWDGRWIVVMARVPERDRAARHLVRTRLRWAGFGSIGPGVWISTHRERRAEAERVLADAGVLDDSFLLDAEIVAGQSHADTVAQAWDLDAIGDAYREFLATFRPRPCGDPLAGAIELVHAWRRFPWIDPGLPRQLLGRTWDGEPAAQLFAARHGQLVDAARAEWATLEALS